MSRYVIVLALMIPMLALGCGAGASALVMERASSDFKCPPQYMKVRSAQGCDYIAIGCRQTATYTAKPKADDASGCCPNDDCTIIQKTRITSDH